MFCNKGLAANSEGNLGLTSLANFIILDLISNICPSISLSIAWADNLHTFVSLSIVLFRVF